MMASPVRWSGVRGIAGQLMRFGAASGLSAIITLGLPIALHERFQLDQRIAVGISQATVLLMNFVTLRLFVFRSRRRAREDVFRYAASAVVFRGLEYASFLLLFELVGVFYVTALVITLCASTVAKFIWYRFLFGARTVPIA
jgi:putative flippase GtrA